MVAPVIPRLAKVFAVPIEVAGLIVPAYLIPYGVATLFYSFLSDRIGQRPFNPYWTNARGGERSCPCPQLAGYSCRGVGGGAFAGL